MNELSKTSAVASAKPRHWQQYGFQDEKLPPLGTEWEQPAPKARTEQIELNAKRLEKCKKGLQDLSQPHGDGTPRSSRSQVILENCRRFLEKEQESLKTVQCNREEQKKKFKEFWNKHRVRRKKDLRKLDSNKFKEASQTSKRERQKRKIAYTDLDPNHSHFIFVDDGGLGFGAEFQFRADIECCVAGNFKGVGATKPGSGGKVLERVDVQITRSLEKLQKGWPNASLPELPADRKHESAPGIASCESCHMFKWQGSGHHGDLRKKCGICLRNQMLTKKLEEKAELRRAENERRKQEDGDTSAEERGNADSTKLFMREDLDLHEVQVAVLTHALKGKVELDRWEHLLPEHQNHVRKLTAAMTTTSPANDNERAHDLWHHQVCVELLELVKCNAECFHVKHRDKSVGRFEGTLQDLLKLLGEVLQEFSNIQSKSMMERPTEKSAYLSVHEALKGERPQEVPMVSVTVQGGPGTVNTVLKAVKNGTPCLFVKGSGQASCLLSDAVLLQDEHEQESGSARDRQQQALRNFLNKVVEMKPDENSGTINYQHLVDFLEENHTTLTHKLKEIKRIKGDMDWGKFRKEYCEHESYYFGETADVVLVKAMKIESGAALVLQKYGLALDSLAATDFLRSVFETAASGKCQVFRLHNTEPDAPTFKDALLACMLAGMNHPRDDTVESLRKKIKLAIQWQCEDVLKRVLRETHLNPEDKKDVLKTALIEGIVRNNARAVQTLFESSDASVDHFNIGLRLRPDIDVLDEVHRSMSEDNVHNGCGRTASSQTLLDKAGRDGLLRTIEQYSQYAMQARAWTEIITRIKEHSEYLGTLMKQVKDNVKQGQGGRYQRAKELLEKLDGTNVENKEIWFSIARAEKKFAMIECVYRSLLSDDFCYFFGVLGPELDLFFFCVLMNHRELAEIFWQRSVQPLRSAITATFLLRELAKREGVEPAVKAQMLRNAEFFEKRAIGVQKMAQESDRRLATTVLGCQLRLWTGMTLLDLAVKSECCMFVEVRYQ